MAKKLYKCFWQRAESGWCVDMDVNNGNGVGISSTQPEKRKKAPHNATPAPEWHVHNVRGFGSRQSLVSYMRAPSLPIHSFIFVSIFSLPDCRRVLYGRHTMAPTDWKFRTSLPKHSGVQLISFASFISDFAYRLWGAEHIRTPKHQTHIVRIHTMAGVYALWAHVNNIVFACECRAEKWLSLFNLLFWLYGFRCAALPLIDAACCQRILFFFFLLLRLDAARISRTPMKWWQWQRQPQKQERSLKFIYETFLRRLSWERTKCGSSDVVVVMV